jgi:hypothetical protein
MPEDKALFAFTSSCDRIKGMIVASNKRMMNFVGLLLGSGLNMLLSMNISSKFDFMN